MLLALKLAIRRLLKTPSFTAAALATFAICVGANLAIFAVVDAILIRPLPFTAADRLVAMYNSYPGAGVERGGSSIPNYYDRRYAIKAFASLSIYQESNFVVGGVVSPRNVPAAYISPEFFKTLGVPLAMGQAFAEEQLSFDADRVAILSDDFWRDYFNADPKVIGRTFVNEGLTFTVMGVLPRDFHFLSSRAQFYVPRSNSPEERLPKNRHGNNGEMIARLSPGSTLADAQTQVNALNAQQAADDPYTQAMKGVGYHTVVRGLRDDHVGATKPILLLLQYGALFLLLIGGVNLANLLLVRSGARAKEFAVRRALGEGWRSIALDALMETSLLAVLGGLCGILLGAFGINFFRALGAEKLPLGTTVTFDGSIVAIAFASAIAFGWLLAGPIIWLNTHSGLEVGLHSESRGETKGLASQRLRHGFVVAQIALALVLLSGAGLLGVRLKRALEAPLGFSPSHILSGKMALPWETYKDASSRVAFVERLLLAIRALPGVTDAAISTNLPYGGQSGDWAVTVEGITPVPGNPVRAHFISSIMGNYWRTLGISLLRGRLLEDADNHRPADVCVVDKAFAQHYWPGADPLGRRLNLGTQAFNRDNALTVVGVVADVKQNEMPDGIGHGAVYLPFTYLNAFPFALVVRTVLQPTSTASMVRKAVLLLDPGLPIDDVRPMQYRLDDSLVTRRSPAILAGIFALVALLLAAIGTFGILSYAVSQRTREIGIRMALGAQSKQIRWQFLSIAVRMLLAGTLLGILGSWFVGRAMQSMVFGIPYLDVTTLIIPMVLMGLVTLVASLLPVHCATRVDPMCALRSE